MIKNRIHSVLHERMVPCPVHKLFAEVGLTWLKDLDLDAEGRLLVDSDLRLLEHLEHELTALDQLLAEKAHDDDRVRLLMTLPGVDVAVAQALVAALGDVHRFVDGDHAASYLGLVPITRQSAGRCYHGSITKAGASKLRGLLVQAAQCLDRHPGPLGVFFRRLIKRKNRNVAVVATARKLVVIACQMLKNNEPYRYAPPRRTAEKLGRLRVLATGKRRRPVPRPVESSGGEARKRPRTLPEVYEVENLPPTTPLSRGEQKMLRDTKTVRAVETLTGARLTRA